LSVLYDIIIIRKTDVSRSANNNIHVSDLKTYEGTGNSRGRDLKQTMLVVLVSPLLFCFIHNLFSMDFIFIICDCFLYHITFWGKSGNFN